MKAPHRTRESKDIQPWVHELIRLSQETSQVQRVRNSSITNVESQNKIKTTIDQFRHKNQSSSAPAPKQDDFSSSIKLSGDES